MRIIVAMLRRLSEWPCILSRRYVGCAALPEPHAQAPSGLMMDAPQGRSQRSHDLTGVFEPTIPATSPCRVIAQGDFGIPTLSWDGDYGVCGRVCTARGPSSGGKFACSVPSAIPLPLRERSLATTGCGFYSHPKPLIRRARTCRNPPEPISPRLP